MPALTFLGTTALTYTQYLDVDPEPAGTTLVAEPLVAYEISVADGWQLGLPPQDGLWSGPPPVLGGAGFNAIPGRMVIGDSSPGYSGPDEDDVVLGDALAGPVLGTALDVAAPVLATYLGTMVRTYTQYLDAAGTTLVAEPQGTYEITPAVQGQVGAVPGDGLWEIPGTAESSAARPDAAGRLEDDAVLGAGLDAFAAIPVTAVYLGTTARTYTQYLDTDPAAGTTLVAEPGQTYDLTLADQWQLGLPPQDGLWGAAPQVTLSFDIIPGLGVPGGACPGFPGGVLGPPPVHEALTFGSTIGLAVIGGMNPGFPGFTGSGSMEGTLEAPVREHAAGPAVRVVRGRPRKLPLLPRRRRGSRRGVAGKRVTVGD